MFVPKHSGGCRLVTDYTKLNFDIQRHIPPFMSTQETRLLTSNYVHHCETWTWNILLFAKTIKSKVLTPNLSKRLASSFDALNSDRLCLCAPYAKSTHAKMRAAKPALAHEELQEGTFKLIDKDLGEVKVPYTLPRLSKPLMCGCISLIK